MEKKPVHETFVGSLTDTGKVREQNEDALFADAAAGLFIVSDGMGGAQAGEVASQMVIGALPRMIGKQVDDLGNVRSRTYRYRLRQHLLDLSRNVREAAGQRPELKGMGATVVLMLIRDERAHIAHMGDSRLYLFRDSQLAQATDDHSVVAILLRDGEITPEEAETHPARGNLSRFIGMPGEVYPDVRTMPLKECDRFLLCTDGLTGMVSDFDIANILGDNNDPQQACEALIAAANQAGGNDNITAVVVDWK
jgi:PPM family protein phosphatase